jgi:hypothetical protein
VEKKPFQEAQLFQQAADRIAVLEAVLREIYANPGVLPKNVLNIAQKALEVQSSLMARPPFVRSRNQRHHAMGILGELVTQ